MKICILCYRGNPYCGGQGIYIKHLSRELARLGHRVTILVGPPYPEQMPWAEVIRLPNHHFWGKRRDFLPKKDPTSILRPLNLFEFAASRLGYFPEVLAFSLRAFHRFLKIHRDSPFDVLHDVETLGYGLLLASGHGVPAVSTVHHPLRRDMITHLSQARSWLERYYNVVFFPLLMQGLVARRIDGLITASRVGKEELLRTFRVHPERVHLVHTGIDLDTFSPDGSTARNPSEILFVGNAQDPRKGIRFLFKALKSLPGHVRLTVVDDGEPFKTYAPGLMRAMELGHRVTFTGKRPVGDLVALYQRAGALVMPSLFEGFGLPVVEAMACGTPVITTRAGALPEVVGEGEEAGILVPPGDARALAEGIHRLISQPNLARDISGRARDRVARMFSWQRTGEKTVKVYKYLLEARSYQAAASEPAA